MLFGKPPSIDEPAGKQKNVLSLSAVPSSFYIFAQQRRLHAVRSGPARPPLPLRPLHAWLLLACLAMVPAGAAQAQTPTASAPSAASPAQASTPLALTPSPWLAEELPAAAPQAPSFISGNKLDGEIDRHVTATGQAEVRKPGSVLKGDVIRYDQSSNTLSAQAQVAPASTDSAPSSEHGAPAAAIAATPASSKYSM